MSSAPLDGITILDFTHALAGPYCSLLMAMYGARVIKVEPPDKGDIGRLWGPPFQGGDASYFLGLNSGKQSLAIDLKSPEGLEICRKLAAKSDILLENFRPGTMNRLGLDYASLDKINPRLIYVSVSGYGQTGPRKNEPAMDLIIQAASGLMSITGTMDGETVRTGHSVADITAGMFAMIGAQLALEARHKTGRGQFVDVSMLDGLMSTMAPSFAYYLGSGNIPKPMGTRFATIVPYRNFMCADREIAIAVSSDKLWEQLCTALHKPEWIDDPDYNSNPQRVKNRAVLEPMIEAIFVSRPASHWTEVLSSGGIPCTPVRDLKEVDEDEQTAARNMLPSVHHSEAGRIRVTGPPVQFSESDCGITEAAPKLGANSTEVLSEFLEMSEAEIDRLRGAGVIAGGLKAQPV